MSEGCGVAMSVLIILGGLCCVAVVVMFYLGVRALWRSE
jgi:hypothetical protein